ncbi:flagellar basal-body MS-ring/collar protein FliF [Buchnera aphidicola]|jgi:flagellar M-ring protein FliF|uniref:Flagellar M-ring protein n=1 Tax=Buchnera aphidicola subsp. Schizaphis graminum (strain Sg) TaxID=198804 RepID=FLIF_BUCAP|nr:flagellar basal-body MS-ring/collar protein FliF [Buchnera aphidicola]Q8KA45.1 RecName: Full=Flagellar M-ring protein [Buchnera aphidicola str. Sg (Schizaphis graminum)]AAM67637.1 flagellar M-ring protein [Buchnera aphidicola str. Sg (Schizaphis graminum)]AWI49866.1 flagellar basal body M-ring protein FliF [Buchnera aphidicola (Schizaphis graminum)]
MNFSTIEESVSEEKKKFNNFLSYFFKNSRVLIILFVLAVITTVSISMWRKSPDYQVLYNNLSNEDGEMIIDQLNQMQIPYKLSEDSGQLLVPKDKVYELRLHFSENNSPHRDIGYEILDKERFGVSQFGEQINYQRALEGELARTIEKINVVKNAKIHIAFPKNSLFLEDKKKPSVSVILNLKSNQGLDHSQVNAILHLISSSICDLSIENITIIDQFGKLLNNSSLGLNQIDDLKLRYSEEVESRYRNRIKNILEPLLGFNNVYAQVTAQINFNSHEKTQEKYTPNTNYKNQAIRSRQSTVNDKINNRKEENKPDELFPQTSFSSNKDLNSTTYSNKKIKKSIIQNNQDNNILHSNSAISHDDTINYELNHSLSHTKMNIGEIKRLSAAVIVNFVKDKNGKSVPINVEQIKKIKNLVREAIGYSKVRGDSVYVVNESFFQKNKNSPIKLLKDSNQSNFYSTFLTFTPWFISLFFLFFLVKKCFFSSSKNNINNQSYKNKTEEDLLEKDTKAENISELKFSKTSNTDKLIHQICNISNQNPRIIASIIRQWMSDKK